ncbi:MAG TPA: RNA polymerase sigma factor [Tepidisphaeraceae bacterium]|nr:RNA polymerase sigma factor [Tepidisphaeraceae bacterium]
MKADVAHGLSQPQQSDEPQLIEQLRRGERAALETLIARNHGAIAKLVSRLSGWSGDSEDLVQEVFVAALANARRFKGGSRLSTWLTRIAINVCRHHHRTRMLRAKFWKKWMLGVAEVAHEDATQPIQQGERIARVTESLRRLKGIYREVVVLHYLEGMTIEQVAHLLNLSRGTIEIRMHRARKMLQNMLVDVQ